MAHATFDEASNTGTGTGNFTPTNTGVVSGQLMTLHICFEKGSDVSIGGPGAAQWNEVLRSNQSTNIGIWVGERIEDGYTWTNAFWDGHDSTTPIDGTATTSSSASGDPNPPTSPTPSGTERVCVAVAGNKKAPTGTPSSGYTERWDNANTGDGLSWTYGCSLDLPDATADDPGTITTTDSAEWAAGTFLIAPAPGAAATFRDRALTLVGTGG
jgi:hypothetical protein